MIALAGAPNFRAVEPVPAADGRALRANCLYRSGALSALTASDLAVIETLQIKLIADLRSGAERRRFPTLWPPLAPARIIGMPVESDREAGMQPLIDRLAHEPGAAGARRAMLDLYAALPRLLAPTLTQTLDAVVTGWGTPLLMHCHVGKDRTGVAIALVLSALGIEREAIVADYMETASRIDVAAETRHLARALGTMLGRTIDPGTLDQLGRVDADYIEAAFGAIDRDWNGMANYLEAIGLTESRLDRLRNVLLA